jgi:hypothetical protein
MVQRQRRAAVRLRTGTLLHLTTDRGDTTIGAVLDVSPGGVGCRCYDARHTPVKAGLRVAVVFVLPTGKVEGEGEIAWSEGDCFSVRLRKLDEQSKRRLVSYCDAPW